MSEQVRPDSSARPLRRDAAENRERLLRAAFDLFAEQGPEVGVNEIARRAGVGPGTLYRRFPTKEALIDELYEVVIDEMLAAVHQSLAGDVPGEALEQCLRRTGEIMAAHRGCLVRLFATRPAGTSMVQSASAHRRPYLLPSPWARMITVMGLKPGRPARRRASHRARRHRPRTATRPRARRSSARP